MASVLLLGASSDMAVAIARKYASEGYDIQLAARNSGRLDTLCSDIRIRFNVNCSAFEFDALDYNSHPNFFNSLEILPDITICVFGYLGDNEIAREQWSETEKIIHTNYTGAVSALNAISLIYAKQQRGTIVGISSVAGERGRQSNYMYGSAKAGFTEYLSGLRNRLYREKVHVLSVQPGFVYTRMTENLSLPPLLTASPEDIANGIFKAVRSGKNVVYIKWFWKYIMFIIRNIPEFIFKKLKL